LGREAVETLIVVVARAVMHTIPERGKSSPKLPHKNSLRGIEFI
jgi:hypothetical protein